MTPATIERWRLREGSQGRPLVIGNLTVQRKYEAMRKREEAFDYKNPQNQGLRRVPCLQAVTGQPEETRQSQTRSS
jgi:hypothetical protein